MGFHNPSAHRSFFSSFVALVPLLALFLMLASLYNVTIPLGEGPDEPGHLAYVLFLAREGRFPVVEHPAPSENEGPGEAHQPPLAYVLALPAVAWLPPDARTIEQTSNPDFVWNGGPEPAAFVRASREYWPWQSTALAWHLARSVSSLAGAATVFCVWGGARTLRVYIPALASPQREVVPLLAAALVAFNPQFLFTSALVTNDSVLAALSAGVFWLCCLTPGRAPLRGVLLHAAGVGLVLGLALLTKQSALVLIPLVFVASWRVGGGNLRRTLLHIAGWGGVALAVAGWWYGRNWHLYGDPLGLALFRTLFDTGPFDWGNIAVVWGAINQLHASFWARFGWLSVAPPSWVLLVFVLLEAVALAGWLRVWRAVAPPSPAGLLRSPLLLTLLLPLLAIAWVVFFALTAGPVAWQGRLLFPALAAVAFLLAGGVAAWFPAGSYRVGAGVLLLAGGLASLALYLPFGVIAPAYQWETLPASEAQSRIVWPLYARFAREWERGVELRGWRIDSEKVDGGNREQVFAGQTITLTLTWHALERLPGDWVVFVHLIHEDERDETSHETIVAEHNSRPRSGALPLSLWTPGDWIEDPHPLTLPPDLAHGRYTVRVGLWQSPFRGKRLPAWAADETSIGDAVDIGTIEVARTIRRE